MSAFHPLRTLSSLDDTGGMIFPRLINWTDRFFAKRDLMANYMVGFMLAADLPPLTMIGRLASGFC